jgi:hypothetical protein
MTDKRNRFYGKVSEHGGADRPSSGIHKPSEHGNILEPHEMLRAEYTTGDTTGESTPTDDAFLGGYNTAIQ